MQRFSQGSALSLVKEFGAGLYMFTDRIWASVGMHAGWNFVQGWLFGSAVSGLNFFAGGPLQTRPVEGFSDLLSGGAVEPQMRRSLRCIVAASSLRNADAPCVSVGAQTFVWAFYSTRAKRALAVPCAASPRLRTPLR